MKPGDSSILSRSCLVVAHPDDEILWFSSILRRVERALICFLSNAAIPDRGPARHRVLDQYPIEQLECLELAVPLTRQWCDWTNPTETEFGLQMPAAARSRYERSFADLRVLLRIELADYANVITHNPWGEYGHEMHVQVYRVVQSLADELGYRVWFSNYASSRSSALAERYLFGAPFDPVCLETDRELARRVRDLYVAEGCWTAPMDFVWFDQECYNTLPTAEERRANPERRIFRLNSLSP